MLRFVFFVLLAVCTLAACSSNPSAPRTTAATAAIPRSAAAQATPAGSSADGMAHVEIQLFEFAPGSMQIPAGTTVIWTNHDAIIHSVTNGVAPTPGGAFDSDFFDMGQTYTFTFTKPGDYPYFCKRHPFMKGEIIVTGS